MLVGIGIGLGFGLGVDMYEKVGWDVMALYILIRGVM